MNITYDSMGVIDQGYYFSPVQTITGLTKDISNKRSEKYL